MDSTSRDAKTVRYNTVLYAVAAVAMLYTLTSSWVGGAILNFCFAGQVPGTKIVLSPKAMLYGDVMSVGLLLSGVLLSMLTRRVVRRRSADRSAELAEKGVEGHIDNGASVRIKTTKTVKNAKTAKVVSARKERNRPARSLIISKVLTPLFGMIRLSKKILLTGNRFMMYLVLASLKILVKIMAVSTVILDLLFMHGRRISRIYLGKLGDWAYPYAARFDSWLELRYRQVTRLLRTRFGSSEPLQILVSILRESKRSMQDMLRQLLRLTRL